VSLRYIRLLIVSACCAAASVHVVHAQETINYASVSGRVIDTQSGTVAGASVRARRIETNVTAETVTDSAGRFRFPYLSVGTYEVTVHREGFTDTTRTVTATVGSASTSGWVASTASGG